ncbi:MAG: hypothetical protein HYX72_09105 [Acidobacteria bacterium]|nr:hypothetical protein [Acidobacteriota bacterium]
MGVRRRKPEIIDPGRAEMEKHQAGSEVKREFDEAATLGAEPRDQIIDEVTMRQRVSDDTSAGDPDADVQVSAVDDETPHGHNPTPDQNVVEDIGRAQGLTYEDNELLNPTEKIARRDRKRWELDPASSEHYRERMEHEGESEE